MRWRLVSVAALACVLFTGGCGGSSPQRTSMSVSAAPPAPLPPQSQFASSQFPSSQFPKETDLSHQISAGTRVPVALKSSVDSSAMTPGLVAGSVLEDVKGTDGRVAIPAGSGVAIFVRGVGRKGPISEMDVGLYAINVLGHQYNLSTGPKDASTLVFTEDSGKGPGHSSVHLYFDYKLDFKLDHDVDLR